MSQPTEINYFPNGDDVYIEPTPSQEEMEQWGCRNRQEYDKMITDANGPRDVREAKARAWRERNRELDREMQRLNGTDAESLARKEAHAKEEHERQVEKRDRRRLKEYERFKIAAQKHANGLESYIQGLNCWLRVNESFTVGVDEFTERLEVLSKLPNTPDVERLRNDLQRQIDLIKAKAEVKRSKHEWALPDKIQNIANIVRTVKNFLDSHPHDLKSKEAMRPLQLGLTRLKDLLPDNPLPTIVELRTILTTMLWAYATASDNGQEVLEIAPKRMQARVPYNYPPYGYRHEPANSDQYDTWVLN
jgi:hypothetical protein